MDIATNAPDALRHKLMESDPGFRNVASRWIADNVPPQAEGEPISVITKLIAELRDERAHFPRAEEKEPFEVVVKLVHCHEILQIVNLAQILHSQEVRSKFPCDAAPVPRICNKQVVPNRMKLCNFTQCATSVPNPMPPEDPCCQCRRTLPECTDLLADGHVMSTDYRCIGNGWLRQQFEFGQRFRSNLDISTVMQSVTQGLDGYIAHYDSWVSKYQRTALYLTASCDAWRAAVLAAVKAKLDVCTTVFESHAPSKRDEGYLKRFHKTFTVCPGDKLSHNFAFVCKWWWQNQLDKELRSEANTVAAEPLQDILKRHEDFNRAHGYKKHYNNVPYLYPIPKLHKPPKMRFLAGVTSRTALPAAVPAVAAAVAAPAAVTAPMDHAGDTLEDDEPEQQVDAEHADAQQVAEIFGRRQQQANCSTSPASRELSGLLQDVMYWLRKKDHALFLRTGIRRYWIIQSAEEFFWEFKQHVPEYKGMQPRTIDFTSMYTNLTHESIYTNVARAVSEAFAYQEESHAGNTGVRLKGKHDLLSEAAILELLHFVVGNTYFSNSADRVIQQTVGLPMGTNAAPEIANLTLYVYEADYVDNLVLNGGEVHAREYSKSCRYIDDAIHFNAPPPPGPVYGLEFTEHSLSPTSRVFLGAKIDTLANGHIEFSVFDKSLEWDFPVIKFPHGKSNAPSHQTVGVALGQFKRFRSICTTFRAFKTAVALFTQRMLQRQHPIYALKRAWRAHLQAHAGDKRTNHQTMNLWYNRLISWLTHHPDAPIHAQAPYEPPSAPVDDEQATTPLRDPECEASQTPASATSSDAFSTRPPDDEPFTERLFKYCRNTSEVYDSLDATTAKLLRNAMDLIRKRKSKPCTSLCQHCWQTFAEATIHKHQRVTCDRIRLLRAQLLEWYVPPLGTVPVATSSASVSTSGRHTVSSTTTAASVRSSSSSSSSSDDDDGSSDAGKSDSADTTVTPTAPAPQVPCLLLAAVAAAARRTDRRDSRPRAVEYFDNVDSN